jgi:hypothetical protein
MDWPGEASAVAPAEVAQTTKITDATNDLSTTLMPLFEAITAPRCS